MTRRLVFFLACAALFAQEPTADALRHGHAQVERMLKDRPAMALYVKKGDAVWTWAARQFAGAHFKTRIDWDPTPLPTGPAAHSILPDAERKHGGIRIRRLEVPKDDAAKRKAFESSWHWASFELINVRGADEFTRIHMLACTGKLSRQKWLRANARQEHKAVLTAVAYYNEVWKPWAKQAGFESDAKLWPVHTPKDFETWFQRVASGPSAWKHHYHTFWDTQIVPYLGSAGIPIPKDDEEE